MRHRLLALCAVVGLVASACATSGDTTTTTRADDTTTTTAAPATTTTTATAVASAPLDLGQYLGATFRLDSTFTADLLNATVNSTPEEVLGAQVTIYERYVADLEQLSPPERAAEYHMELLALMRRALETTRSAQEAVDSGDSVAALAAGQELITLGEEMIEAGFDLAEKQGAMVEEVLAERDDPESRYLIELLSLQSSETALGLESLLSQATSPDVTFEEIAVLYRDIVAFFEATLADYQKVTPPDSWGSLYEEQVDLLEDGIVLYTAIADALETGEEPELDLLFTLFEFIERGPALNAKVTDRIADQLEGRPPLVISGSLPGVPRTDDPVDLSASGMPAPVVSGANFDGNAVAIEDDGRPKAIVFLAHWCPHCQTDVAAVQAWLDEGGGVEGADLYSVATAITPGRAEYPPSEWLKREGWSVPVIVDDDDNSVLAAFGNGRFPFWVFVNSDGTVAGRIEGELPITDLEVILQRLTGGLPLVDSP